jgi:hypothetical protein
MIYLNFESIQLDKIVKPRRRPESDNVPLLVLTNCESLRREIAFYG